MFASGYCYNSQDLLLSISQIKHFLVIFQNRQYANNQMNGPGSSPGNKNRSPKGQFYQPNRSPGGGWTSAGKRSSPGRGGGANFSPGRGKQQGFNQTRPGSSGAQGGGNRNTESYRYFILKCSDTRNIELSYNQGIWCTTPGNEKILSQAFRVSKDDFSTSEQF